MTDFKFKLNNRDTNQGPDIIGKKMAIEKCISNWLTDPSQHYMKMPDATGKYPWMPYLSPKTELLEESTNDSIIIIAQFFLTKNNNRTNELKSCISLNCHNKAVSKIYLLNERVYTPSEIGTENEKIEQVNIGNRLKYKDVFDFVEKRDLKGIICLINCDIFFDASVDHLRKSQLEKSKKIFCQLRTEYKREKFLKDTKLFGPRCESQDAWIFHSSQNISPQFRKLFNSIQIPNIDLINLI